MKKSLTFRNVLRVLEKISKKEGWKGYLWIMPDRQQEILYEEDLRELIDRCETSGRENWRIVRSNDLGYSAFYVEFAVFNDIRARSFAHVFVPIHNERLWKRVIVDFAVTEKRLLDEAEDMLYSARPKGNES